MLPYINVFGVKVSSYGLCMLIGIVIVTLLSIRDAKKKDIIFEDILIVVAFIVAFFVVGAWTLYTIVTFSFYDIIDYIRRGDFSFINNGGLVFYGGLFSGIIGALIGIKICKLPLYETEEIFVPYISLGHAIGRVGCFLAGCCAGIEYQGIFAIHYKNSLIGLSSGKGYFPTQLLEAVLNVFISLSLLKSRKSKRKTCDLLFLYLLEYSVMRFFVEFLRGDNVRGIYFNLSTSQWISMFLFLISALYLLIGFLEANKEKK